MGFFFSVQPAVQYRRDVISSLDGRLWNCCQLSIGFSLVCDIALRDLNLQEEQDGGEPEDAIRQGSAKLMSAAV